MSEAEKCRMGPGDKSEIQSSLPGAAPPTELRRDRWAPWILGAAAAAVVVLAAILYIRFLDVARYRWDGIDHDRHAHCRSGMLYASLLKEGRVIEFLREVNRARMWPPLHGLSVAGIMLLGGLDSRLAFLPSLAAWAGTAFLAFLLARKLFPRAGYAAGLAASTFFLQSPAHRLFATEVMLESLGAFLTLLVLLLHARAAEAPSPPRYRALGLALTALFLTKYNYWLMAALGLLADAAVTHGSAWWMMFRSWASLFGWRVWIKAQLRHPLTLAILASLIAILAEPIIKGLRHQRVKVPANLIHIAFLLLCARVAFGLWRSRKRPAIDLDPRVRQIALWHGVPMLVWFLLPKHLGYFLYFLSPWNGPNSDGGSISGVSYYLGALAGDFHLEPWSAVACAGLAAAGALALSLRGAPPGSRAVIFFTLIAAFLTVRHPNRKSRFLCSSVPALWVLAGAGMAWLIAGIQARRWPRVRLVLAGAAAVALSALHAPGFLDLGHCPGIEPRQLEARRTPLDLSDGYLPLLADSHSTAFFATVPIPYFFHWTYLERYHDRTEPVLGIDHFDESAEGNRARFEEWLAHTDCDTIVFLDIPRESHFYFSEFDHYRQFRELLESQSVFHPRQRKEYPQYGCAVTVFARAARRTE